MLRHSLIELRDSDNRLSEHARGARTILNKYSSVNDLLKRLILELNILDSSDALWPEITEEKLSADQGIEEIFKAIKQRLENPETNREFILRVKSCVWIMQNFHGLLSSIESKLSPDDYIDVRNKLATIMQRVPKLPLFSKGWVNESNNTDERTKLAIQSINRKFLRLLSAINQLIKAKEHEISQQQLASSYLQDFWRWLSPSQVEQDVLVNSVIQASTVESAMNASWVGGAFFSDEDLFPQENSLYESISLENSLLATEETHSLENEAEFFEAAERAVQEIEDSYIHQSSAPESKQPALSLRQYSDISHISPYTDKSNNYFFARMTGGLAGALLGIAAAVALALTIGLGGPVAWLILGGIVIAGAVCGVLVGDVVVEHYAAIVQENRVQNADISSSSRKHMLSSLLTADIEHQHVAKREVTRPVSQGVNALLLFGTRAPVPLNDSGEGILQTEENSHLSFNK